MAKILINETQLSQLNHVPVDGLKVRQYYFPDFLVIGPQRTGSTWLHRNIDLHPEIFLSPRKETHYFNGVGRDVSEIHGNLASQRFDLYSRDFSPSLLTYVRKNIYSLHYGRTLRSLQLNPLKMFNARMRGEMTASYAAMDKSRIDDVCLLNPEIKAVLFLRHPVDRAWSEAKLYARMQKLRIDQIDEAKVEQLLTSEYFIKCGSYSDIVDNWQSCLASEDKLHIELYDNISVEPDAVLTRLYKFLGVNASVNIINKEFSNARVNVTDHAKMPQKYYELLSNLFESEVQFCKKYFDAPW